MFPIERDKIVRSTLFDNPFRWNLMTSSNIIDIYWWTCMIKVDRLKRRKKQIWKWFLLNSCFTFSGGLSEHFRWEFLDFDSNRTYFGSGVVSFPIEKTVQVRHLWSCRVEILNNFALLQCSRVRARVRKFLDPPNQFGSPLFLGQWIPHTKKLIWTKPSFLILPILETDGKMTRSTTADKYDNNTDSDSTIMTQNNDS